MKSGLTIATLAFAGIAGVAYAQSLDPYEQTTHELDESPAREVYIAQGPSGPDYISEDELRLLKREARAACGDKPDGVLDLVAWKIYRRCVWIESSGINAYTPYYPYEPRPD
jgi:hypothetical protein